MNLCKWGDLPVNLFTGKQFILEGLRLISIVTIGDNSTHYKKTYIYLICDTVV